ncbi:MAG: branched-chain amino acid ABC transporter substrate-binding protein [Betaproteobacteria bacterium]|nr:branched-chain amino acid ABC transporter substrate-binding protein [Betaproteobacteria bacterium]MDE2122704.1 branched-chain amino acid ABC transporter substrate-binding protein [Betaproteobacteria bacterium]MDE2186745.1 branched-chain amino acid ABC transporter substrate-binding protein [Betaproteobacteria bacterium]MDE2323725.1 branched-chain amino acid ABC transporter substrate-binding protein [Betaproteobacteria bacterium]
MSNPPPSTQGRLRRLAVLVAFTPLAATLLAPGLAEAAETHVVIGVAVPLSGALAAGGQDVVNGVQMAIDKLNAEHARIDGKPVRWTMDAEDDQGLPTQATLVAQKLVDEHVNGVVGHQTSGCTFPAARIYSQAGIPQITPSSTDPKIAQQGYKTFFRMIANDNALGAGLADYAHAVLKARRVAVIDDRSAYGEGVANVFAATAKRDGMDVVDREYTDDKTTQFAAILTRIRGFHPDVVFYGGMYSQAGPLLRQMRQFGMKATLMGGDGICAPAMATLAGQAVNGTICAQGGVPLSRLPKGQAWKADYIRHFGQGAFQLYSPYAYDATMVLAHAMMKARSADPKVYLHAIRDVDDDGITKSHIRFTSTGELVHPSITLSMFVHGKKTPLAVERVN